MMFARTTHSYNEIPCRNTDIVDGGSERNQPLHAKTDKNDIIQ